MATHSVILPGESHGQRSLVGYSSQGCKESDTTDEQEHTLASLIPEILYGGCYPTQTVLALALDSQLVRMLTAVSGPRRHQPKAIWGGNSLVAQCRVRHD